MTHTCRFEEVEAASWGMKFAAPMQQKRSLRIGARA